VVGFWEEGGMEEVGGRGAGRMVTVGRAEKGEKMREDLM